MKNKISILLMGAMVLSTMNACKKSFLDVSPQGVLDEATLASEKGVNRILLSAYAMLDGHDGALNLGGEWGSGGFQFPLWKYRRGEANKGSDPNDQGPNMTPVQRHDITATNGAINDRWKALYEGVKRSNTVLQVLAKVTGISDAVRNNLAGQARFLRAWYHFQARITFGKVPYLNEQIDADLAAGLIQGVANDTKSSHKYWKMQNLRGKIFPATQDAIGRINKWAAGAFYGKALLFNKDFPTALTVLRDVVTNGTNPLGAPYNLNTNYDDNFNVDFDNSVESVIAFQASSQDNAGARNGNWGDLLNTPSATGGGGAGFFTPTYFFTNQFKTDASGLPVANPHNTTVMDPFAMPGFSRYTGNVDTRLDWTVGRDGVPFHDWGTYLTTWPRDRSAGPFAGKKTMIRESQVAGTHDASVWFVAGGTALNMPLMRFADVILLLAEAEVEAGTVANAFTLVNRIRNRAKNSRVVAFSAANGTPRTEPYTVPFADQGAARTAVRLERALELGMEGHRFFDLVRWGTSVTELNNYYNYEAPLPYQVLLVPKPTYAASSDYYPIPQQQIDLSNGFITP